MQFSIIIATFLATLATAAPVAVPKTTVVEREAGGGLPGLDLVTSLLSLGGNKGTTPQNGQQQPKAGGGLPGLSSLGGV